MSYQQEEATEARVETAREDGRIRKYPHNASNNIEKDAPLKRALKRQEQLLVELGDQLNILGDRLAPISVDLPESVDEKAGTVEHMGDSSIVRGIVDLNTTIEEYIRKVTRLRSRLEL